MARAPLMVSARLGRDFQNNDAVDEISQRAAYTLIARIADLQNRTVGGLRGFFSGIVSFKVKEYVRSARRDGQSIPAAPNGTHADGAVLDLLAASDTTPYTATERRDQIQLMHKIMARLGNEEREVLYLALFDQLNTSAIGERLGISRSAAYMRLSRAFERLQAEFLEDSGVFRLEEPD